MTTLSKLKPIWKDKNISVKCKVRLLRALVLSIFLYACETWTFTAELQRRIQTLEMRSPGDRGGKKEEGRTEEEVDNIKEWTKKTFAETQALAHNCDRWRDLVHNSSRRLPDDSTQS
ncbi:hypothetical protein Pcinc_015076 [Petrolisthes cinctipes]|uniref:Uncharacterized protein n=1 Tax=Petrolisthes cinctipes TaxID=88211 RepID=A0AAE1FTL6_PETCI|nr:hypothetical protein Pcinc_015076 [Petrolisthes cinctipes]